MRFEGRKGNHADKMGDFTMQCEKHRDYPVYANDDGYILFYTEQGRWMVGSKETMPGEKGWINSAPGSGALQANLKWNFWDGTKWIPDNAVRCSEA